MWSGKETKQHAIQPGVQAEKRRQAGVSEGRQGGEEEAGHDNPVFLPANRVIVAGDGVARV